MSVDDALKRASMDLVGELVEQSRILRPLFELNPDQAEVVYPAIAAEIKACNERLTCLLDRLSHH